VPTLGVVVPDVARLASGRELVREQTAVVREREQLRIGDALPGQWDERAQRERLPVAQLEPAEAVPVHLDEEVLSGGVARATEIPIVLVDDFERSPREVVARDRLEVAPGVRREEERARVGMPDDVSEIRRVVVRRQQR